jgi:hypothetical protein
MPIIPVTQDRDQDVYVWMEVQENSSGNHISDIPSTKHGRQSCSEGRLSTALRQVLQRDFTGGMA